MKRTNQKYLPESKIALTKTSSEQERMRELLKAIETGSICYGKVKYCHTNADYLIIDLGFGINGFIPKKWISISRKVSIAHSLVEQGIIVNFKVVEYNPEKGFILNRAAVQIAAEKWQTENFEKNQIISARIISIYDKGILVDIGGGVETFIPPHKLVKSFEKDFNNIFEVGQTINLKIEGFDNAYESWILNYVDCPQFGISINSTYAVEIQKKKKDNSWYCSILPLDLKGYVIIKGDINNNIELGDIEKATIISFIRGVPLLKAI